MILRKISIFGFKSFANKTELSFGEGMTAVIGPNGCGKTNVVDALRWVFGEQKASILRSSNMQDVIFSGSEKRHPLNMAEVTLTIANNRGILPIEYNEVAITRRIFRNGESEYLINKNPSRLKDIHNMFLDTGVGSNAYTTIENSMINRILSDKAEERRILFEEAAGIGKFKKRIKESQKKLERTKQDLLRINDRVQEKDKYVKMLGRQVERAIRYKRYSEDLKTLEVGLENRRFVTLSEIIQQRTNSLHEIEKNIDTLRARIAATESKIEKKELEKVEKENELQIASKNVSNTGDKINAIDREISVSNQSLSFLKKNIVRFNQEIESIEVQNKEKSDLLGNIEKSIVFRETEQEKYVIKIQEAKREFEEFEIRVLAQKEKVDELSSQQLTLVHKAGEKHKELSNSQTNLSHCLEQCERDEKEIKHLEISIEEYGIDLLNCKKQLNIVHEACNKHMQARDILLQKIKTEDDLYHTLIEKEKHLEAQLDSSKSKLHFLEGLDAAYEGYDQGVKALLKNNLPGTLGIVADLIDVDSPNLLNLVERVLGSSIQTVVFKNDLELQAAITYLVREKVGVARMISMETLKKQRDKPFFNSCPDEASLLRDHIKTEDEYGTLADYFFNHILLCETVESALKLQSLVEKYAIILSRDGTICYSNGTVIAGMKKEIQSGILHRKKEIDKLRVDIKEYFSQYNTIVREKEMCIMNRDEAKLALIEVDEKLNSGRQSQQEQETNIKHYENEIQNLRERIQRLLPLLEKNRSNLSHYELHIQKYESELEELEIEKKNLEAQKESNRDKLSEMDDERARLSDTLKNCELAHQGVKNRLEQDKQSIEHLKKDIQTLFQSKQKKMEDNNNAFAEIKTLEKNVDALSERLSEKIQQREKLQKILGIARESYNETITIIAEKRKEIKILYNDQETMSNKKHGFEVDQTRDDEQRRAIREKIYSAYEIDLQSPSDTLPIINEEDATVKDSIFTLKERLRRVGEVNLGAVEEHAQEENVLKEMVEQRDDLQSAVDDLEQAIKKLNRQARIQFLTTFEMVQKNFREMFTTLFEGGEVSLTLEENVDPLFADISINARPAGKKMRGVTLLSGGERALISISLLFALYLVKPSAYCVLDELDAPLDDANVDRFINVLKKFAEKTQFIVITHNKHTMEAADVLYGVTQIESGVSTIASVKLGEEYHLRAA